MLSYFPIYFKQLGLSASYAGILAGLAPILSGTGAILFGFVADKTQFWKFILLVSLAANAITPVLYAKYHKQTKVNTANQYQMPASWLVGIKSCS